MYGACITRDAQLFILYYYPITTGTPYLHLLPQAAAMAWSTVVERRRRAMIRLLAAVSSLSSS